VELIISLAENHPALVAVVSGGFALSLRALVAAVISDLSKRLMISMWGIRAFDTCLGWIVRNPVWSDEWEVVWDVQSSTFQSTNVEKAQLSRAFNKVALEGSGITRDGKKIRYGFLGDLSRGKTIITGTWFDRRGGQSGYYGAYQLRLSGTGEEAVGRWVGFSETTAAIKSGRLTWKKLSGAE
jgi:hypothetical protein